MSQDDWLAERAAASPRALALWIGEQQWTYGELDTAVTCAAAHLQQQGVQPGDFVALLLPNGFAAVALIHALARLGAVLVPLNTRLTAAELRWQLAHVEAKWLLTVQETEGVTLTCKRLLVHDAWFTDAAPLPLHRYPFTLNRLQSIVFTSGTSGKPKGVMLSFANHFWSATASAYRLGLQPDDVWLSVLPLYHVGGLAVIFRSCLYGTAVDLHPRFDLDAINHALDHKPITLISVVPTMLHRLLHTRTHWPTPLRLILLGGAAAPPELIQQANTLPREGVMAKGQVGSEHLPLTDNHLPLIAPTYGLTEAASQVATMRPQDAARKPGSVGKPLLFTRVQIVDEEGRTQPPGVYGEVVVTGPTVMAGYYAADRQVAVGEAADGTIHTGDIGYVDADGDLFLLQRRSDLIVSGGENVYPAEVEAVLRQHTAVSEACVVGVPDAEWGQRVAAMVQVGDTAVTTAELTAFCRQHLAGYKIPRQMKLVEALPLTASGKIARQQVAQIMQIP